MIDDAASWSWGRFVERDATPFNMAVLWEYIEKNGRMVRLVAAGSNGCIAAAIRFTANPA